MSARASRLTLSRARQGHRSALWGGVKRAECARLDERAALAQRRTCLAVGVTVREPRVANGAFTQQITASRATIIRLRRDRRQVRQNGAARIRSDWPRGQSITR